MENLDSTESSSPSSPKYNDNVSGDVHQAQKTEESCEWFEEFLGEDYKWSIPINRVLYKGKSKFQDIALLDTERFGKVLVLDGKLQSAERDEFIYHECLVHPALLLHDNPRTIFIMGGGEGSTAREILKYKSVDRVVMCDIDEEVVNFCRAHLSENQQAFSDKRLDLIIDDAKAELEKQELKFDVIIGDLADPIDGGPCNQLYTKSFYEGLVKTKLGDHGIFVTQAGLAGILTHKEVFTSIYNTLKQVFKYVVAYTAHVPSYLDTTGFIMASDEPLELKVEKLDERIKERIVGELKYLDGPVILASTALNNTLLSSLVNETHIYTEDSVKFIHGHGIGKGKEAEGEASNV